MLDFEAFFDRKNNRGITDAKKFISEYTFYIGWQELGIKIYVDLEGNYGFVQSHFADGYRTSINGCFESEEIAMLNAIDSITPDSKEDEVRWVRNEDYIIGKTLETED